MGGYHSQSSTSKPSELEKERVGLQNTLGQNLYNQGGQIFGEINPTAQGMLNNPVTPGERSAIFETSMAPVANTYDALRANLARRAATSRNPAGLIAGENQAARQRGEALSTAANGAEMKALQLGDQRRQAALAALGSLYGINQATMSKLLGGIPENVTVSSGRGFNIG
jgi:hypothetical protein